MDHFCLFKIFLGNSRSRKKLLLWANSQFQIQYIIGNSAVKDSAWLTADTCVIGSVVIENCNVNIFVPNDLRSPVSIFYACLIDA